MSYITSHYYPLDCEFDEEARQIRERQPFFMLKCSKIPNATYKMEVSKKNFSDITNDAYLYYLSEKQTFFCLDKNCSYLLGVFDSENKRILQFNFDEIKVKSNTYKQISEEFKKINGCVNYQNLVKSYLSEESDEYKKSSELANIFKEKYTELEVIKQELEKVIENMISQYIIEELRILTPQKTGINFQGTLHHYLEFFINKKYYKYHESHK